MALKFFSNNSIKFFKDHKDDFKNFLLVLGAISVPIIMIVGLYIDIQPEDIGDNPEIKLNEVDKLIHIRDLIILESVPKSYPQDELVFLSLFDSSDNVCKIKYLDVSNPNRLIVVLFVDPNGLVRFSNTNLNENINNELYFDSLEMGTVDIGKNIKIKTPTLDDSNIYGEWHLVVYLYDENEHLTKYTSIQYDYTHNPTTNFVDDNKLVGITVAFLIIALIVGLLYDRRKSESDYDVTETPTFEKEQE